MTRVLSLKGKGKQSEMEGPFLAESLWQDHMPEPTETTPSSHLTSEQLETRGGGR